MDDVERMLPASERRRTWARDQGYSARSAAMTASISMATAAGLLLSSAPGVIDQLAARVQSRLQARPLVTLSIETATELIREDVVAIGLFALWGMAGIWCAAVVANLAQTGFRWSPAALSPDVSRIDPASGMTRLISADNLAGAVWSVIVIVAMAFAGFLALRISGTTGLEFGDRLEVASRRMLEGVSTTMLQLAGALACVCILDVVRRRWRLEQSLRMSLDEQQEEAGRTPVTRRRPGR